MHLCLFFILLAISKTFCQENSIEEQIKNYYMPKNVLILEGRNLLLKKISEQDLKAVKEIKDSLIKLEDDDFAAFGFLEYQLILYYIEEFQELLNTIKPLDSIKISNHNYRPHSIYSNYSYTYLEVLTSKSRESSHKIKQQIYNANFSAEDTDFLILNFEYLTVDYLRKEKAKRFLDIYPDSRYKYYIKYFIGVSQFNPAPKNLHLDFELFSGYGIFTGELSDNYKNNIPIGLAIYIGYKKIELNTRMYIGFAKAKKVPSDINVWLGELDLGYAIIKKERFKISPFVGIALMSISPPSIDLDINSELKSYRLDNTITYTAGMNFDILLKDEPKSLYDYKNICDFKPDFLRIRYEFSRPKFSKKYKGISGDMHGIIIGIGWSRL